MHDPAPTGHSVRSIEQHIAALEAAFALAQEDPATWGGWSWRFNQRLVADRRNLGVLTPPPGDAEESVRALYEAAEAIRALWDAMNVFIQGGTADVVGRTSAAHAAADGMTHNS